MTVVAAIAGRGRVWMAADTGVPTGGLWAGGAVRKVRRARTPGGAEVLLGVTGAAGAMAVALRTLASRDLIVLDPVPYGSQPQDLDEWATAVAGAFTEACAMAAPPLTEPDQDGMTCASGSWLLGYAGRLWHLHTHNAAPVGGGVAAIGIGAGVAMGWMLALRTGDPGQVVSGAVAAACAVVPYCSAPGGPLVEVLDPPPPSGG